MEIPTTSNTRCKQARRRMRRLGAAGYHPGERAAGRGKREQRHGTENERERVAWQKRVVVAKETRKPLRRLCMSNGHSGCTVAWALQPSPKACMHAPTPDRLWDPPVLRCCRLNTSHIPRINNNPTSISVCILSSSCCDRRAICSSSIDLTLAVYRPPPFARTTTRYLFDPSLHCTIYQKH